MQQINQALTAGYAAFQRGAFDEARRHLEDIDHVKAIHLLGLVEKNAGDTAAAARLFERAAELDPQDPEIANNRAALARQNGDVALAESEFRRALAINPTFRQASTGLGRLLIDTERWQEALELYEPLVAADSGDVVLRYGLATAILNLGRTEEAADLFDALIREGNEQAEIRFMRGRARLELNEVDAALEDLVASHVAQPSNFTLRALASTYWMQRNERAFLDLLEHSARVPELAVTTAEIFRQSGDPQKALDVLAGAREVARLPAEGWSVAATAHVDLGEAREAEAAARACLDDNPADRLIIGSLLTSLLMQGKAEEAMPIIRRMRESEPDGQHWIAYEATALRLMGSERYRELVDLDRFVRPYELPVPDGFETIEDFNAAFLEALEPWHQYETHPLDQSLRDGSQTPRDLTTIDDPVIQAFYRALDVPIRQYMADVGSGDDHPLTARNTGDYRIAGAWSVRLHGGGRHVNHVHPEGWISSAYYVAVPDEARNDAEHAGCIKFAEPPFATVPPTPPEKWIRPRAGVLVLFPSFLWHGTQPIHDGSVRVTAPFDAVPA
ncbi:MAG: tetratricopeptide repeat protein [Woeseiaceae bacterium]|nr:tetratricopeptide repeat protein [Woeseiaceae bacterium]